MVGGAIVCVNVHAMGAVGGETGAALIISISCWYMKMNISFVLSKCERILSLQQRVGEPQTEQTPA